jgi:hypothetical protein
MTDLTKMSLTNNAPRRYFVDGGGRRVLIGLTVDETCEFERLDSEQVPAQGQLGQGQAGSDGRNIWLDAGHRRRLELYEKHEGAWRAWMAQSRTDRGDGFSLS